MKKMVSFFGERSPIFTALNQRAEAYAAGLGLQYCWEPQTPYHRDRVIALLREADAGVIDVEPYGDEIFREIAGRTQLLVRFGVGYDKVDLNAATAHGIAVARTTGANTLGVAEMALTLLLAARRQLKNNQRCVDEGRWEKNVACETIGSTLGLVGFGAIGQALAELMKGFACRVIAYDPHPDQAALSRLGVEAVSLEELFTTADAVSLHLPYTPDTHHLIGAELLARMKPSAVLVNTARGNIVEEQALCAALQAGRPGGAALDVFATEPLPLDSPLRGRDNLLLTPHVSSQTEESLWRITKMAVDIAADFWNGKGSPHILNPAYRDVLDLRSGGNKA